VIYAMFLRYAWHNDKCFPGQARLADDIGMSIGRVNQFLDSCDLPRQGQPATLGPRRIL
jgi:hypothetical protein